jgi:hypothetical protein
LLSFVAPYRGIERRWTSSIEEKLRALLPGVGEQEKPLHNWPDFDHS